MTDGADHPADDEGTSEGTGEGTDGTAPAGTDTNGGSGGDTDLAARMASLERTVEELGETVAKQRRAISYLAVAADIESVEPVCPECTQGVLQTNSGLTWTQVSCPECGLKHYL